MINVKIVNNL